jgi:DNA-binding transcriptional MerR regulator
MGLVPPVARTPAGYRRYTAEHVAYFGCVREMLGGFSLARIARILQTVMAGQIDAALWLVNNDQAELHREKMIAEKIVENLLRQGEPPVKDGPGPLTIHDLSRATGVPATTLRYWDKAGLIKAERDPTNRYRLFNPGHIRQVLTIYALKFAVYTKNHRYSVEQVREELAKFSDETLDFSKIVNDLQQHLNRLNRAQIKGIAALYRLCAQVETGHFSKP